MTRNYILDDTVVIEEKRKKLEDFAKKWNIKYIILFGSRIRGKDTPLSDWDIAVRFGRRISGREYIYIIGELVEALDTDKVDLVVLDLDVPVELAYDILWNGEPIIVLDKNILIEDRLKVFRDLNDLKIKQKTVGIEM